jgi:ubiquinone/menaquinone biosynthesis C-methylase UbiE
MGIWLAQERPDITLTGIDPSTEMIRIAISNVRNSPVPDSQIQYVETMVEDLSMFNDNTFGFVFSNESLHHWTNPVTGFREIERVLKRSGGLYIWDERRDLGWVESFVLRFIGPKIAGKWHRFWSSSVQASYTIEELEHMLREAEIHNWSVKKQFLGVRIERQPTIDSTHTIVKVIA